MKTVRIKFSDFEERMLSLLTAKYKGRGPLTETIRQALVNEFVRTGVDRVAYRASQAEREAEG